ncbi:hypothetical protein YC2023_053181 [Brassica napus]
MKTHLLSRKVSFLNCQVSNDIENEVMTLMFGGMVAKSERTLFLIKLYKDATSLT